MHMTAWAYFLLSYFLSSNQTNKQKKHLKAHAPTRRTPSPRTTAKAARHFGAALSSLSQHRAAFRGHVHRTDPRKVANCKAPRSCASGPPETSESARTRDSRVSRTMDQSRDRPKRIENIIITLKKIALVNK